MLFIQIKFGSILITFGKWKSLFLIYFFLYQLNIDELQMWRRQIWKSIKVSAHYLNWLINSKREREKMSSFPDLIDEIGVWWLVSTKKVSSIVTTLTTIICCSNRVEAWIKWCRRLRRHNVTECFFKYFYYIKITCNLLWFI